ncbi:MAG: type I pullulanase [Clostridia bacterium]|nr:type I pullulanase [Clostridia bacterium]
MKRITAFLLIAAFAALLLTGCTGPSEPGPTGEPAAPTETGGEGFEPYDPPREDGTSRVVFYWYNETGVYDDCDMWIWLPNADGHGYAFHPCEYGAKVVLDVPQGTAEVGFIVRRACSDPGGASWGDAVKDYDGDRFAAVTGDITEVYLKPGDGAMYRSDDGGKTLYQDKVLSLAGMISLNEIKYTLSPATRITSLDQVKVTEGGREIAVESLSSLNNEVIFGVIKTAEELDISKAYTLEIEGFAPCPVVPTEVFDSEAFNEKYAYDLPLGVTPTPVGYAFTLWAPTAQSVSLNIYADGAGGEAEGSYPMLRGEHGEWTLGTDVGARGKYYTYTVTTALGTNEIVDPYAKAVGVNGDRGMVLDLESTDPEGWENDRFVSGLDSYEDAVIWEVHVRDFSNRIASSEYPGKYLAFTETGLKNSAGEAVGLDYLKDLGVTHVHLQPIYDYATVDEADDAPQFNWGYDPKNYNAPEGSYSTDPYHGEVRVNEVKRMVQALHQAGIGVVMDVVYNHTYSADSCLGLAVPYYYYRYDGTGALSNGSGCGNETASERTMFRRYMVDSVSYWASEYHIDGFRFDLMALHDIKTMQEIEAAVHGINPCALIYGEGWTGGTSALRENERASQANISQITPSEGAIGGIAVFNDSIRDGLKGSVFNAKDRGYINGAASQGTANSVLFGIAGGGKLPTSNWGVEGHAVINYMACHDNNTIWDKLLLSNPEASDEERAAMNRFGAEIIMLSKGTPFMLAGEEMLRSKDGNSNSYNASDEINNIDWERLVPGSAEYAMRGLYRDLIAMRKANAFLTDPEVHAVCQVTDGNVIEVQYMRGRKPVAVAFINPGPGDADYTVGSDVRVLTDGSGVYPADGPVVNGSFTVPARSVFLAAFAD